MKIHKWLMTAVLVCGWLSMVAMVISAAYIGAYWNKILPGVKIAGREAGNLSGEQAAAILEKDISEYEGRMVIKSGEDKWEISAKDIGTEFDIPATINKAWIVGREGAVIEKVGQAQSSFINGYGVPVVIKVDERLLESKVATMAAGIDEQMVEPGLMVEGVKDKRKVSTTPGKDGVRVDRDLLTDTLIRGWSELKTEEVELPVTVISMPYSAEAVEKARSRAERLLGKQLRLKLNGQEWVWNDEELINILSLGEEGGLDRNKLAEAIDTLAEGINRPPQNAAFQFENGRVTEFRPGTNGQELLKDELAERINKQFERLAEEEVVVQVPIKETPPETATADVNDLGIRQLLGRGESTYKGSIANRMHNVALASSRINGVLVKPGEMFSFNQTVGEITAATGYKAAYVISGGRTILGDGGGVCQVSTTLFRSILKAGLPVTERKAHAYRVSYYEQDSQPGFDATVFSPTVDLKFKNDTPAHLLIQTTVEAKIPKLTIDIYGTADGRVASTSGVKVWGQAAPPPPLYQDDPTLPINTTKQIDWAAWGAKASFDYKVTRNEETIFEKTFMSAYRPWQAVYLKGTKTE